MSRTAIVAICVLASSGLALAQPTPLAPQCDPRLYLEPSLFVGFGTKSVVTDTEPQSNNGRLLDRIAVGVLVPFCGSDVRLRGGVTGFLANFRWAGHDLELGAGAEVSIDTAIHDGGRLGVRFGAESLTNSRALLALGGRYYVRDTVWFGVDGFLRLPEATDSSGRSWGLMVGVGATGRAGVIAGLADLSLGATLAFIAVILGAGGH